MRQAATIYAKGNLLVITTESQTTAGFWITVPPVITAMRDEDAGLLLDKIESALDDSETGIPTPDRDVDVFSPVLAVTGDRSFSSFMKEASAVGIERNGDLYTITPLVNKGAKQGFAPNTDRVVRVGRDDASFFERFQQSLLEI